MASVNLKATAVCAGGDHVTIVATLDGAGQQSVVYTMEQITENLNADDARVAALMLIRLRAKGKTNAQLKSDLQGAGLTVTI